MKADYAPEVGLLLIACTLELTAERKVQFSELLARHSINWDRLYTLATRHRITSFLYRTYQQLPGIPELFLAKLQADCRKTVTDNLLKLHEYHQLEEFFNENRLEYRALKGIYLAEHAYPDSSLRISGDIDVLICEADVSQTIELLQERQYRLNQKHSLYFRRGKPIMFTELCEVSLFKPFYNNNYFENDLHRNVFCFNKHYELFDLHYGVSQPKFATEHEIILLVTHHGVNNIWQHIYYINDLYFVLNGKSIDWEWLIVYFGQTGSASIWGSRPISGQHT